MNKIGIYLITSCLLTFSGPSWSQVLFQDVSDQAGLTWIEGDAYEILDAAWIDFNSDGFPDLWTMPHGVSHWYKIAGPQLLINQSGTNFTDVIDSAWPKTVGGDKHSSCWGDFDNDGDLDVFFNQGGAGGKRPSGPKQLLVNEEGLLVDRAEELGLSPGPGRGRGCLWFDWNKDGWLDLIMLNKTNSTHTEIISLPSKLFAQTDTGFVDVSTEAGFIINPESIPHLDSAINGVITHLFNDNIPDIVVFDGGPNRPSFLVRVYRNETPTLEDITDQFPISIDGNDAVVADFNQDAIPDIFIVEGKLDYRSMIVHENDKNYLLGHFRPYKDKEHGMSFKSADNIVTFDCQSEPTSVFIGAGGVSPNSSLFTLSPTVPYVEGLAPRTVSGTYIGYDSVTDKWTVLFAAIPSSPSTSLSSVMAAFSSSTDLPIDNYACDDHSLNEFFEDLLFAEGVFADELFALSSLALSSEIDVTAQGDFSEVTPISFTPVDIENDSARFPIYLEYDPTLNKYVDRAAEAGFTRKLTGQTVVAGDFDNDMDQDIYIRQVARTFAPMQSVYYENQGDGTFIEIADARGATVPILRASLSMPLRSAIGPVMAVADYDLNGFLDIFTAAEVRLSPNGYFHVGVPARLFKNQGNSNRWLQIDLEGTVSNRDALGAKVLVHTPDGRVQVRVQDGGGHTGGQNQHRLHFGLGSNASVDLIEIVWPNGNIQVVTEVDANQILHIKEKIVEDIILDTEAPRTNGKVRFKPEIEQWESSTQVAGYWGNNYYHDNNQDQGNKEVFYRADFPVMGTYEVFLRWPANDDQASYVEVVVGDKNKTYHLSIVDQTTNGGEWVSVGQYAFEGTSWSERVIVRNRNANGRVIADAVKFVWKGVEPPPSSASPTEIIMDSDYNDINGKVVFKPDLTSWQASTTVPGFEGLAYYHDQNEAQGTKKIIYLANIPQAGIYEVFLKWTADDSHATNVSVVVRGLSGTHSHKVNQTTQGSQWVSLGEYTFAEGTSTGRVIIKNRGADGYVIADAVKFVWKGTE